MQIKDQERLKSWLTITLESMCIAKPAILIKYIFWLLKLDQSINELKKLLLTRLEKFLNDKTETFITLLVVTLQNKLYLNDNLVNSKTETAITSAFDKSDTDDKPIDKEMSCSLVPTKSHITKDNKFTGSTRYRRDDYISDEDKERESYRKYRYHNRSCSQRRSQSPNLKRKFRSPKHYSQSQVGLPIKKLKRDIVAEFKQCEGINKKTSIRCVNFDEKGYCVKGDSCVNVHEENPVVLATDGNSFFNFQNAESSFTDQLSPSFPVVPLVPNLQVPASMQRYSPSRDQRIYNQSTKGSYCVRGNVGKQLHFKQKRGIDSVFSDVSQNYYKRKNLNIGDNNNSNSKTSKFDYRRLGPKVSSNDVYLKNVPENINKKGKLNNTFKKFGKITNIKIRVQIKEATITFSIPQDAQKAFQNMEAVFSTSPITVNWYSDNEEVKLVEKKNTAPRQKPKTLHIDNSTTSMTELTNAKKAKAINIPLIKNQEEVKALPQNFYATITKFKQEMLDKNIQHLNKLIEATPNDKDEKKKQILITTNIQLKTNIENIKPDLESTVKKPITSQKPVKVEKPVSHKSSTKKDKLLESKQDVLKNALLADLDLFIKQRQGHSDEKEILDLKRNVMAFKWKLRALGSTPVSAARTAKTAYQMKEKLSISNMLLEAENKMRETKITSISVDCRVTQLFVSGFRADDLDQV